jgi:hypothetical protein
MVPKRAQSGSLVSSAGVIQLGKVSRGRSVAIAASCWPVNRWIWAR